MNFTCIGESNYDAFSLLLSGGIAEDKLYIGVIEDDKAVGAGEFSSEGNLLVIDSVFVLDEYRRRGIGSAMLDEVTALAQRSGAGGVWTDYAGDTAINGFLTAYGFFTWEDCAFYQVPLTDIVNSETCQSIFSKLKEKPEDKNRVVSFAKLSATQKNVIKNTLVQYGLDDVDEMIASLSTPANSFAVYRDAEKKNLGAILITDVMGDFVTIKYLANIGGNPKDLVFILKLFWGMVVARNMTEKILTFCTTDQEIKQIIGKFAGQELTPTGSMMVAYKELGEPVSM